MNTAWHTLSIIFTRGFRPFFLLSGLWAVVPMFTVGWSMSSGVWPVEAVPLFGWHGHEMIFGFVTAAIAGFLLTAVPNWTGTKAISGYLLVALVLLWAFGRAASAPLWTPVSLIFQLLSVAFLPALAIMLAVSLVRSRNYRNLPFLLILGILFVAEFLFQAPRFGWMDSGPIDPLRLALNTVLVLVVIIGGRIIPSFTRNAFAATGDSTQVRQTKLLDLASVVVTVAVLIGDLIVQDSVVTGIIAGLAAMLLGIRFGGWGGWRTLGVPLLWVLHLGYGWLIIGLALKAVWLLAGYGWSAHWMHAITAGSFGTMILAVTTRVALGHTGRPLIAPTPIVASYLLISFAVILRVWGPWLAPNLYWSTLLIAICSWVSAYVVFLLVYTPILVRPRIDGKAD